MPIQETISFREKCPHYIAASENDIQEMLSLLDLESFDELYQHLPNDIKFTEELDLPKAKSHEEIEALVTSIASKNNQNHQNFLGDGLPSYKIPSCVPDVLAIRGLTTSYTPYQPERSQGTLNSHWVYQSLLRKLTGFEAINASMYDRASALYEAINCAARFKKCKNIFILDDIYPGDRKVIETMQKETELNISWIHDPNFKQHGLHSLKFIESTLNNHEGPFSALVFPQVNSLGKLLDVDSITDLAHEHEALAITIIDPILLGSGGLKAPADFGKKGADILVGEGQHLAIAPNFGGPGLGIFGVRHKDRTDKLIRSTAGRFVGKSQDTTGRECKAIILSTREQHIKREKANSNICSNQAFIATLAGAAILERGEEGMSKAATQGVKIAQHAISRLTSYEGFELAFPESPYFNEVTFRTSISSSELIIKAKASGIALGVDVSDRIDDQYNYIKLSFSDLHDENDVDAIDEVLKSIFNTTCQANTYCEIPKAYSREGRLNLPTLSAKDIIDYYQKLGHQNISPDSNIYPLGSCTMKYNPYINDAMAALDGFQQIHPQMPEDDIQGCLEILYDTQHWFEKITGLAAVTTEPLAGAQGELVGLKMFQAYHRSRGDHERNVILIPKSAHGTNPATATMAGFENKIIDGKKIGVVLINATEEGEIDTEHLQSLLNDYQNQVCGIMVTNPNTSGLYETQFKKVAEMIHDAGGLVYMDGANMNAIAAWVHLGQLGVDAVHNNLHKTWSIPHGGGGPGDAIVAVSEKLVDFLPGYQVIKEENHFKLNKPPKSIGSFHRHFGNFAHKVRCYTYLLALGSDGIKRMSAVAVLSARYLHLRLAPHFPTLPATPKHPIMHEFILTLSQELLQKIAAAGIPKNLIIGRFGKLFLDFGFHAPTVSFPEVMGVMIEPTESYTKAELDRFADACIAMKELLESHPQILKTVPHFTPIDLVDEVSANKNIELGDDLQSLPKIWTDRKPPADLLQLGFDSIKSEILKAHEQELATSN